MLLSEPNRLHWDPFPFPFPADPKPLTGARA